ncbi:MAG TPA: VOC family protein [Candidatus Limivicinus faecipullorum]|nr:VOC family protein [Candidatus Limivicinus faecipullorum]
MKLDAIHHVAIIVSDYRRSREFYVDKLGFRVIRENYRQDRGDWKLDLACGDIELEIFARPRAPERPTRPEALGLRHLAFKVEDIEGAVAELAALGIPCEEIRLDTYTGKKMTFFFDPDQLPLELHQ